MPKIINRGRVSRRTRCAICDRRCGSLLDRCHEPPRPGDEEVPLGEIVRCELCGKAACPDCLHECECCFDGIEPGDPAPSGWELAAKSGPGGKSGMLCYVRSS